MATSPELMYAILAKDSYNRGYNPGILLEGTSVGTANIAPREVFTTDAEYLEWQDAGFYAVAYEWNGKTIISYRGTDNDAGVRPGSRATFVSAKVAKTSDAPSGLIGWAGRELWKSGPTRMAQTRPAGRSERPSLGAGRQASIGEGEREKALRAFTPCLVFAAQVGLATGQDAVVVSVRCGRVFALVRCLSSQPRRVKEDRLCST